MQAQALLPRVDSALQLYVQRYWPLFFDFCDFL